jgi:16S rRNA (cytidine1402-2'-O)-methyltransferase
MSHDSKGILYVVATPIGNLEDMTLRGLKTLKAVQLVAAEDTRRTGTLLRHFQIETPILSVHEHNERGRAEQIINRLDRGDSVALVTDAGTPAISDPGAKLVHEVRAAGFRVEPIPGPSAVVAGLSASGIDSDGFTFLGFPPIRGKDRTNWLTELSLTSSRRAAVFYEAPHRIVRTLAELSNYINRPILIGRELTKIHEEFVQGTPEELSVRFPCPQGEFVVMVPPTPAAQTAQNLPSDDAVIDKFCQLNESTQFRTKKEAARAVAEELGLTAKQVYTILERNK